MNQLSEAARVMYRQEMLAAKHKALPSEKWRHLERAHILSQPHPWLHTMNHFAMLNLGVRQRDRRDAIGQVVRIIVAAPGSIAGRYPEGNTGRREAGLMTPMPVPDDLDALLHGA